MFPKGLLTGKYPQQQTNKLQRSNNKTQKLIKISGKLWIHNENLLQNSFIALHWYRTWYKAFTKESRE